MTVKISTLANGLRVATDTMDSVESVTLGIWVGIGSRHEEESIMGISHLLEHMAFKGTATRSAQEIAETIENVGGFMNAHTTKEHTAYYTKVLADHTPLAVEILSDILQHPIFAADELAKEKQVVLQEIGQAYDTPDDIIFDYFYETAFPNQSLGRSILGTAESLSRINQTTLAKHLAAYHPEVTVFAAAGKIEHDAFLHMVEQHFTKSVLDNPILSEDVTYKGGYFIQNRPLEQIHFVLGFPGLSCHDPDYYALGVLSTILGGGMSSRLFQEIRERHGLVYSIYSFTSSFKDTGVFGIYAGTSTHQLDILIPTLCQELKKMGQSLDDTELNRAKNQLKAGLLMERESTSHRCDILASQLLLYNRALGPQELMEKVDAITKEDILRLATRLFQLPPTICALGPLGDFPLVETVSKHLASINQKDQ